MTLEERSECCHGRYAGAAEGFHSGGEIVESPAETLQQSADAGRMDAGPRGSLGSFVGALSQTFVWCRNNSDALWARLALNPLSRGYCCMRSLFSVRLAQAALAALALAVVTIPAHMSSAQEPGTNCPDGWRSDFDNGWAGVVKGVATGIISGPTVNTVTTWDPDGPGPRPEMLVVAGTFDQAGNALAKNLAMFDGERWTGLSSPLLPTAISAMCVYQGRLIVVGSTYTLSPTTYLPTEIACFDGVEWTSLGTAAPASTASGKLTSLKVIQDSLYVGGAFASINGVPAARIARWNGLSWSALGDGLGGGPAALEEFQGKLIAAGGFIEAGGAPANRIAAWNGNTWSPLGDGLDSSVNALTVHDNTLIVGGTFHSADGQPTRYIARWDGQAWDSMGGGLTTGGLVTMLTTFQGRLLAGYASVNPGGTPFDVMASWNGSQWVGLNTLSYSYNSACTITQSTVFRGKLVVSGSDLIYMGDVHALGVAQWDGQTWSSVCAGMGLNSADRRLNVVINAMTTFEGDLVAAGIFHSMGGVPALNVARWDGSRWHAFGGGIGSGFRNGNVQSLVVCRGQLIACAYLSATQSSLVLRWNGATWDSIAPFSHLDGVMCAYHDELYVASRQPDHRVVLNRWDGEAWSVVPGLYGGTMNYLYADNDWLYLGGDSLINSFAVGAVALWNGSSWVLIRRTPDGSAVFRVAPCNGSIVAATGSTDIFGHGNVYQFDGAAWTSIIGSGFFDSAPYSLVPFRDGVLMSGHYASSAFVDPQVKGTSFWDGASWALFGTAQNAVNGTVSTPYNDGFVLAVNRYAGNGLQNAMFMRWGPNEGPTFDRQPASQSICASGRTSFLAPATGSEGLAFRWQFRVPAGEGWGEWLDVVDGANSGGDGDVRFVAYGSASFTLTTVPPAGISSDPWGWVNRTVGLRCLVSGACRTIESDVVELRILGADVNCDGVVNADDLTQFLEWFESGDARADVNHDGAVDFFDYDELVRAIEG